MSLCKGGCLKSCIRAIVKCTIQGEGDDKGGDERGGGGGGGGGGGQGSRKYFFSGYQIKCVCQNVRIFTKTDNVPIIRICFV